MIQNVHMNTGNQIICIDSVCRSIGKDKARALLSLHALSYGKRKNRPGGTYLQNI